MGRVVLGGICLFCIAAAPVTPENRRMVQSPPALELRRVLDFLLETEALPDTGEDLSRILAEGLRKRLAFPRGATPTINAGGQFPNFESLNIDFTHAVIDSDRRTARLRPLGPFVQLIRAREFKVTADPVNIDGADMRFAISAEQVDLGVQRDPQKKPILVFRNAQGGRVDIHTTTADLGRMFHSTANMKGKKYGLDVKRAVLRLSSENDHQLRADLRLFSTLVLIPVQINLTARVDFDDNGMITLSHLTCDGSDLAGWLISGMIRPALDKYNGRTMPLVNFPSDRMKVRDVRIKLEDGEVRLAAAFGRTL